MAVCIGMLLSGYRPRRLDRDVTLAVPTDRESPGWPSIYKDKSRLALPMRCKRSYCGNVESKNGTSSRTIFTYPRSDYGRWPKTLFTCSLGTAVLHLKRNQTGTWIYSILWKGRMRLMKGESWQISRWLHTRLLSGDEKLTEHYHS